MVGRKPKPTAQKQLEGSRIRGRKNEPQPTGIPKCPPHLDKAAKAEWKRISRELISMGLLTNVDRAALAAYCHCWARFIDAEEQLKKFGLVIKSPKSGYPIQNPYLGISNTALDQLRKFGTEFGMTPASRSRISVDAKPTSADPFTEFMSTIGVEDVTETVTNNEETIVQ